MLKSLVLCAVLWLALNSLAWGDALQDAARALQEGNGAAAQAILDGYLNSHPHDPAALGLLAASLDVQKKWPEAEAAYKRALEGAPHSASLLNNYGNHLLSTGDAAGARMAYRKVLTVDPKHPNANLQLAIFELDPKLNGDAAPDAKRAAAALAYLKPLDPNDPRVQILRMRALFGSGKEGEAKQALLRIENESDQDPRLSFSAGLALAGDGRFAEAESLFSRTLEKVPSDFDVLYNLGLAAAHSKHWQRAQEVLKAALAQRPADVDTLVNLAAVDIELDGRDEALALLADAARLDPARASTQKSLAETASALGYYADALAAYDRYLAKVPGDESARRERAFMLAASGHRQDGLDALLLFARSHGHDATAQYEIGILQAQSEPAEASDHLNRAVTLDPQSVSARFGRGVLAFLQGDAKTALPDLQWAAEHAPANAAILDRLGEAQLALGRDHEAVLTLRRASQANPENARVLMHLSRALSKNGNSEEAKSVLARFRALGADRINKVPPAGFVEFLSLPPEQQQTRYEQQVQARYKQSPDDPNVVLRYLKLCVGQGNGTEAESAAAHLASLNPPKLLAADAGHTLLQAGEFAAAEALLDAAAEEIPSAAVDRAVLGFHQLGPEEGLRRLKALPESDHHADFFLAEAEMLEAAERYDEADAAYREAIAQDVGAPAAYEDASLFLARHGRTDAALKVLQSEPAAAARQPHSILVKAAVLSAAGRAGDAEVLLKELQTRWPEWADPYVTYGILLEGQKRASDAKAQLETAVSLGAASADVFYYLAKSTLDATPEQVDEAAKDIARAFSSAPDDPGVQALAGRIDLLRKNYDSAIQHLTQAERMQPRDLQTRFSLAQAYRAVGRADDAARESAEFQRLRQLDAKEER